MKRTHLATPNDDRLRFALRTFPPQTVETTIPRRQAGVSLASQLAMQRTVTLSWNRWVRPVTIEHVAIEYSSRGIK